MSDALEFEAVIISITEVPMNPPVALPPYLIYFKREGKPVEHMMLNGFEELKNLRANDRIFFRLEKDLMITIMKLF